MSRYYFFSAILILIIIVRVSFSEIFTLEDAQKAAVANNLELQSLQQRIKASETSAKQSGVFSNPELEMTVEGIHADEIEVAIRKTVAPRKKRSASLAAASAQSKPLVAEYDITVLAIQAAITRQFCTILSIKEKTAMIDSLLAITEIIQKEIAKRVDAGAAMQIDLLRAQMSVSRLILQKNEIEISTRKPIQHLRTLLSDTSSDSLSVTGTLVHDFPPPSKEFCFEHVINHPVQNLFTEELALKRAQVHKAETAAKPDINLIAGYKRDNDRNEHMPVIGAGIEIPVLNRNRHTTAALSIEQSSIEIASRQSTIKRKSLIKTILLNIEQLDKKIADIKNDLLPTGRLVNRELYRMYQEGRVSFIEVIESQTEVLEFKKELIELELERALFFVDLGELCGYNFSIIK